MKQHRGSFRIGLMCQVLRVCRSGYGAWVQRQAAPKPREDNAVENVRRVFEAKNQLSGWRGILHALRKEGIRYNHKRIKRIMKEESLVPKTVKKFVVCTTDSKHDLPLHPNLLERDFIASKPYQKLVSDITYVRTQDGWLYLAIFLDLYSRRILGWAMAPHMKSSLLIDALNMACMHNPQLRSGAIVHSDRGSQYASHEFQDKLRSCGFVPSMSRKGNCWDNAVAESFFGTLKQELIYQKNFQTKEEAKQEIFQYIEVFYNRKRLHSTLGYLTPHEFETQYLPLEHAA